jgi:hypothetical protein
MKRRILPGLILNALLLLPRAGSTQQPFVGTGSASPFGGKSPGLANGGFHSYINPSDYHYAFESLVRHTHPYEALHGYEHYRGKAFQQIDRFPGIQYPKQQPF